MVSVRSWFKSRRRGKDADTSHPTSKAQSGSTSSGSPSPSVKPLMERDWRANHAAAEADFPLEAERGTLQERLWNDAYDALKERDGETVEAYERILTGHLGAHDAVSTQPRHRENEIGQDREKRRSQMETLVQTGLEQSEKSQATTQKVDNSVQVINYIRGVVERSVNASPEAAVAWVGVSFAMEILTNPVTEAIANLQALQYVLTRMDWYWNLATLLLDESRAVESSADVRNQLAQSICNLYQELLLFQIKSVCRYSRSRAALLVRDLFKWDDWDSQLAGIKETESAVDRDSKQFNTQEARSRLRSLLESSILLEQKLDSIQSTLQRQMEQQAEFRRTQEYQDCLRDLHITDPSHDKARIEETKGGLLRDAYSWVLGHADFQQWQRDPSSRLLWIKGDPGKGNTMLVCGIINEVQKSKSAPGLLSFFFCQATDTRLNHATGVLRGLIYQLVDKQPSLMAYLSAKHSDAGKALFEGVNAWAALSDIFTRMLNDPNLPRTTLIVDALDECITDLPRLLDFITRTSSQVKWIVSGRPWPSVQGPLNKFADKVRLSLELNEQSVAHAVQAYIQYKVEQLSQLKNYDQTLRDTVETYLVSNAHDTFLWVALVCQELSKEGVTRNSTRRRLKSFPSGLDSLYDRMLQQINKSDDADLCRRILTITSIAYRPLALEELLVLDQSLENALESTYDLEEVITHCGSFLTSRKGIIYFVHQSAKDFILEKASTTILPLDMKKEHYSLCLRSIQCLSTTLRRNIHNLSGPGACHRYTVPPSPDPLAAVRYSCVYWMNHLLDSMGEGMRELEDTREAGILTQFLEKKLLNWIEALSLLSSIPHGIKSALELQKQLQGRATMSFRELFHDACHFIRYYKAGIESAPLQVYASALIFSPTNSNIRQLYQHEEPSWIFSKPQVANDWNECLLTLEGHDGGAESVAFAPDGQRVASASSDKTVKIWDAATGACLQTLEGHSETILSVAFAPDCQRVASASWDKTVKIWDAEMGTCLQTLEQHLQTLGHYIWMLERGNCYVATVAFSPDGRQLVSSANEHTVNIWDTETGACLHALQGHESTVLSVAFTSDGRQVASASWVQTAKIWDAATGACMQAFEGHDGDVTKIAFSPDDRQVASASNYGLVKIWDVATGACQQTFKGHDGVVTSVAFAPDGWQVASASSDGTVKIWDAKTAICLRTFEGHGAKVTSVAFAPDGQQVVSASWDGTVKIWDMMESNSCKMLDGHGGYVFSVALTLDGRRVASASWDKTIKTWDTATGACKQTFKGHNESVDSVVFAPDGRQVASASSDDTVRIWDTETATCLHTLRGHGVYFSSVAYAPDGRHVASASHDVVRIWDAAIGVCLRTLRGHNSWVTSVAFSPDGQKVASGSLDATVKIWDIATGACQQTLEGHTRRAISVAFARNGREVASVSPTKTLKVWDVAAGECLLTLEGYGGDVSRIQVSEYDSGYNVREDLSWITHNAQALLWLPPDFRPSASNKVACMGETVAIGTGAGRVFILKFAQ